MTVHHSCPFGPQHHLSSFSPTSGTEATRWQLLICLVHGLTKRRTYIYKATYTSHATANMNNSDLSQITSQIPDFIGGLPKRGRPKVPAPQDEFDQYFDYKRFYEGTPAADADSRSRSDASSIPGLTSGPSEEDGAPSPRSTEDAFHFKEAVEKLKQHDDRFTVPAREIRPNGVVSYPWHMEIDNTLGSGGADAQGFGSSSGGSSPLSPASSSGGASSSSQNSSSCDSPHSRGKRHRPLDNPEKVAQMRKLGACFRCKTRKITVSDTAVPADSAPPNPLEV